MIKFVNNYHTHTLYCGHADGHVEDYVSEAIKNNMKTLGFSEHGYLPLANFTFTNNLYIDEYINECHEAKEKYKDKIKIYCGLEMDYFPFYNEYYQTLLKTYDYLSLSVHFYNLGNSYNWRSFSAYALETKEKIDKYKDLIIQGMKTQLFSFVNHPDNYLTVWNNSSVTAANEIIDASIKYNIPLEFNINQFFYSPLFDKDQARYSFWKLVGEKQAPVIINADCHSPQNLYRTNINKVLKYCEDLKLNVISEVKIKNDYK